MAFPSCDSAPLHAEHPLACGFLGPLSYWSEVALLARWSNAGPPARCTQLNSGQKGCLPACLSLLCSALLRSANTGCEFESGVQCDMSGSSDATRRD